MQQKIKKNRLKELRYESFKIKIFINPTKTSLVIRKNRLIVNVHDYEQYYSSMY